jgi:RNase P subunit RPR2
MFPLSAIERPRCSKCYTRMMLARISLAGQGREERLFECPKCDHTERAIAEDPLKSAVGWLGSELKPPT